MPADPEIFRSLLSGFATGVTVATTMDAGDRPSGMTVSAVAAVSLDPPLVLMCVNQEAKFHSALREGSGRFALNVLAREQEEISETFASSVANPFASVPYRIGEHQLPLLDGVVAQIICTPWEAYEAGDHTVFLGTVVGGELFDRTPLVHFRSDYTTTQPRDSS